MSHNVLITGGSGYLGGTILAHWAEAKLQGYQRLFALVRKPEQAEAVRQYGAEPLQFSLDNEGAVKEAIITNKINIVYFLIDAYYLESQLALIRGLSELKKATGQEVHFIYTSGTKQFSSLAGAPNEEPLLDTDSNLYEIHKTQKAPFQEMQASVDTNCRIIEYGEEYDVNTYVFSPCIVYGKGDGFGNRISIQTVDVIKAALAAEGVYTTGKGQEEWPVCHLSDTTSLYLQLLRVILSNKLVDSGRKGFYLASSGRVAWHDLYKGVAEALFKRGLIKDSDVHPMTDEALDKISVGLGVVKETVIIKIGGNSNYWAEHGRQIGWAPRHPPEHLLQVIDEEVDFVLKNVANNPKGHR